MDSPHPTRRGAVSDERATTHRVTVPLGSQPGCAVVQNCSAETSKQTSHWVEILKTPQAIVSQEMKTSAILPTRAARSIRKERAADEMDGTRRKRYPREIDESTTTGEVSCSAAYPTNMSTADADTARSAAPARTYIRDCPRTRKIWRLVNSGGT